MAATIKSQHVASPSPSGHPEHAPAHASVDVIALTARDDFLLELGATARRFGGDRARRVLRARASRRRQVEAGAGPRDRQPRHRRAAQGSRPAPGPAAGPLGTRLRRTGRRSRGCRGAEGFPRLRRAAAPDRSPQDVRRVRGRRCGRGEPARRRARRRRRGEAVRGSRAQARRRSGAAGRGGRARNRRAARSFAGAGRFRRRQQDQGHSRWRAPHASS